MAKVKRLHIIITAVDFDGWVKPVPGGSFQGYDLSEVKEKALAFKKNLLKENPGLGPEQVVLQESFFAMRETMPELRGVIEGQED